MKTWKIAVAVLVGIWLISNLNINFETVLEVGIPLLLAGTGVFGVFNAVTTYRRSQYVEDFPTSTVQSAAAGLTEIKGRVVPAEKTITSPFEKRECVLCQYVVQQPSSARDDDESTLPIDYGVVGVPFYVEDETGRMLIRPNRADIRIPKDVFSLNSDMRESGIDGLEETDRLSIGRGSRGEPPVETFDENRKGWYDRFRLSDRMQGLISLYRKMGGSDRHRPIPDGTVEFAEARLEEGDQVYVLGTARSQTMTEEEESMAGEEPGLFIGASSDRKQAASPIGSYFAELLSVEDYIYFGSDYRSIFVISNENEERLISSWRSKMWKELVGGFVLFIIGLIITMVALGYPAA